MGNDAFLNQPKERILLLPAHAMFSEGGVFTHLNGLRNSMKHDHRLNKSIFSDCKH